jgi:hypothetical protein
MKKVLLGVAALPFLAGAALAADTLNDDQMDRIIAGDPTCTSSGPGISSCASGGFVIPPNTTPGNLNALLASYYKYLAGQGYPGP